MKILHLCLANFFYDDTNYQENLITKQNAEDGYDTFVIASTENLTNGENTQTKANKYINKDGVTVERLEYVSFLPNFFAKKIRLYKSLSREIANINPNIIVLHGAQTLSTIAIAKFMKKHNNVKLFVDNHAAEYNSAQNFLSKYILHRCLYRMCFKYIDKYVLQYIAIGEYEKKFMIENYKLKSEHIKIIRLPANIKTFKDIEEINKKIRNIYNYSINDTIYVHSGKMGFQKKTNKIVEQFHLLKDSNSKLILVGKLDEDIKSEVLNIIKSDMRIQYIGWMKPSDLQDILCMADFIVQPYSPTITIQQAISYACVPVIPKNIEYKDYVDDEALLIENDGDLNNVFLKFSGIERKTLDKLKYSSYIRGKKLFSIKEIANVYFNMI